jgi:hypothetical protein
VLAWGGCGSDISGAASSVAERFHAAFAFGNGTVACALLAPPTKAAMPQSGQAPCSSAILDEDIPDAGQVLERKHFGGQRQVRPRGDTAFLGRFADGWKVVSAACTSRGELRYDCRVFVLAPGERARAPVGWGGWDGPPASGKVLVTWAGGQTQVTADGPVQPEADGPATNLWSSWFEQWARCQSCGTTLNGSTPSAASEPPEQSSAYRAIAA